MRRLSGCLALALLSASCETTTETSTAGAHLAVVRAAEPTRAWRILDGERELGTVVLYEAESLDAPTGRFFSVRNPWQQELGTIDAQGRAYRHVPHGREARWVATGTLAEGVAAILAAPATAPELVPGRTTPASTGAESAPPGAEPRARAFEGGALPAVELVEVPLESVGAGS